MGRNIKAVITACSAAAFAWLAAAPVAAAEPGSRQSREFVQAASQSDTFEILESRTALVQSTNPQVRDFAQHMIQDHMQTSQALQQAAMHAGIKLPPMTLGGDQAMFLGGLQSLRGQEFDQAYARHQSLAHRSALATEQGYAAGGDDPALRQAASAATTVIAAHLAMADRLLSGLGGQ